MTNYVKSYSIKNIYTRCQSLTQGVFNGKYHLSCHNEYIS